LAPLAMAPERRHTIKAESSNIAIKRRQQVVLGWLMIWLAAVSLSGCAVKFIGDYDAAIDTGVSDVQQRAEVYFGKLKVDPATPYDPNFYNDIGARLTVLKTRAHILPQYPIIEQQLQELQGQFDRLQRLDKEMTRPFPIGAITAAESAITISVESILRLELALKRGDKNAPSLGATK
jgi:hypothetical protein